MCFGVGEAEDTLIRENRTLMPATTEFSSEELINIYQPGEHPRGNWKLGLTPQTTMDVDSITSPDRTSSYRLCYMPTQKHYVCNIFEKS